jgi:hypothetical protein
VERLSGRFGAGPRLPATGGTRNQPHRRYHRQSKRQERRKRGACIDPHGFDAGKLIKGKKRHILVDTPGLLLHAIVHAADVQDRDGGILLLATLFGQFPFLRKLFADSAYQGPIFANALRAGPLRCLSSFSTGAGLIRRAHRNGRSSDLRRPNHRRTSSLLACPRPNITRCAVHQLIGCFLAPMSSTTRALHTAWGSTAPTSHRRSLSHPRSGPILYSAYPHRVTALSSQRSTLPMHDFCHFSTVP